jgi:uncharacterized protein
LWPEANNPATLIREFAIHVYRVLMSGIGIVMKQKIACCCIVLCVFSGAAFPKELIVDFPVDGQRVIGTLNLPDDLANPPVVLLLHGFTGSRDEMEIPSAKEGIFSRTARLWAEQGIASLRIDFRGSGVSEGEFADTTLDGQVKDGLAALEHLTQRKDVDTERMAIVGWSMGGAVGAAVAARTEHEVDAVALWAPGTNMAAAITFVLGPETVKRGLAARDNTVDATLPWGTKVQLKGTFFQNFFSFDPVAEITGYDGPLLVVVGSNDEVVFPQPESGQILLNYHPGVEELIVWPMDHTFNVSHSSETVDSLIKTTGAFITKHLD